MQIDRDIAMPKLAAKNDKELASLVPLMEIGDSILTDYKKRSGAASVFTLHARRAGVGHNFVTAMDGDKVRVWRKS